MDKGKQREALARGMLLAQQLFRGEAVTTAQIRERFGVSRATAKRDLLILETTLCANREVLPSGRQVLTLKASE